jgi:hypothetical protein
LGRLARQVRSNRLSPAGPYGRTIVHEERKKLFRFEHEAMPVRVIFRLGTADRRLAGVLDDLGARRVLVIVTEMVEPIARQLVEPFAERVAGMFSDARPHVPKEVHHG